MNSLEQLVRAAQSGQRDAFARLVERFQRAAIATACSVLHDFHAAQDAAQDSFLIAFEQLGTLRNTETFCTWLLTIVRREAIRRSKQTRPTTSLDSEQELIAVAGTSWYHPHEELLKSIGRLPDHEREVVVFHYLDGYTAGEISDFTGRSVGTITKQLSRAVERLRKSLKQVPQ